MKYLKNIYQIWNNFNESWKFAIIAFISARVFFAIWSGIVLLTQPVAVHYVDVGDKAAVIFLDLHTNKTFTYFREMQGASLNFKPVGINIVADQQTGSQWDIRTGISIQGSYRGRNLAHAQYPIENIFPYYLAKPYSGTWLALWQRFDANWYLSIAENGYGSIKEDIHFPPFYPLLINLTKPIFGNSFIAGLVISHIATLYALKLMFDVFKEWGDISTSQQSVFYFLIYPTSFFLFSAYTESLFLVTILLSLRSMNKRSWAWAGFWIFCAITTRLQGIALLIPMLYLLWRDARFLRNPHHWAGMIIAGTGPIFYIYLRSILASTSIIPLQEPSLYARLAPPWVSYMYAIQSLLSGEFTYIDLINWITATLFILLLLMGWQKIPVEYSLFAISSLIIVLTRVVETQPLMSMSRYSLTLFPAFYILSLAGEKPWARRIIIYTCIALNLYLSQEFFSWGWVA